MDAAVADEATEAAAVICAAEVGGSVDLVSSSPSFPSPPDPPRHPAARRCGSAICSCGSMFASAYQPPPPSADSAHGPHMRKGGGAEASGCMDERGWGGHNEGAAAGGRGRAAALAASVAAAGTLADACALTTKKARPSGWMAGSCGRWPGERDAAASAVPAVQWARRAASGPPAAAAAAAAAGRSRAEWECEVSLARVASPSSDSNAWRPAEADGRRDDDDAGGGAGTAPVRTALALAAAAGCADEAGGASRASDRDDSRWASDNDDSPVERGLY